MNLQIENRHALVCGASQGIGRAAAGVLARLGARCTLLARDEQTLGEAVRELSADRGQEHGFLAADFDDAAGLDRLLAGELAERGPVSILVNNASILGKRAPLADVDTETWDEVLRVNTSSLFYTTRPLLPSLVARGDGSIINVSSSVGRRGKANWGPYAVSKFGLEGFTQVLAEELRSHGIRVNSVNPGATRTEMRAAAYPDEDPLTLPTPEEIAPIFVYLASDDSKSVTGQAFEARDYLEHSSP